MKLQWSFPQSRSANETKIELQNLPRTANVNTLNSNLGTFEFCLLRWEKPNI